jgi:pseudaminic acid synthase
VTEERAFTINGRSIGSDFPPYIIAELSANHCGELRQAIGLIEAAAAAGADAVKLQHYKPETMTVQSERPEFRITGGTLWDGQTLFDLYGQAMTPWEWTDELIACAEKVGIAIFSTPFDATAVEFLEARHPVAYKVASFEITDLPLIRLVASKMRPVILSTGMASIAEIDAAVKTVTSTGNRELAILRCNSSYPASPKEMDLATIAQMSAIWSVPIGLSDHTLGATSATVACALGASLFEKHLTLSRENGSADAAFSCEPDELKHYVTAVRTAHDCVGGVRFGPVAGETASLAFRRSIRAIRTIEPGEKFTEENVQPRRPAGGVEPAAMDQLVGGVAKRRIEAGEPIVRSDLG